MKTSRPDFRAAFSMEDHGESRSLHKTKAATETPRNVENWHGKQPIYPQIL